jgi:hypothetical protein
VATSSWLGDSAAISLTEEPSLHSPTVQQSRSPTELSLLEQRLGLSTEQQLRTLAALQTSPVFGVAAWLIDIDSVAKFAH